MTTAGHKAYEKAIASAWKAYDKAITSADITTTDSYERLTK